MPQPDDSGKHAYVGVDLGGTTISAGVVTVNRYGSIHTIGTDGTRPGTDIVRSIIDLIGDVSLGHIVGGIGVGVPVPAGPGSDRLDMSVNITSLEGYPLRPELEQHFGVPVVLENDANCMALGEYGYGALRGCSVCVCMTLGTGLGCGIVIDGEILHGSRNSAGEMWNIPLEKGGVIEDRTSIRGLVGVYEQLSGEVLDPPGIYDLYSRGDSLAEKAFGIYGEYVGIAAVTVMSMIDPDRIAIGGGLSKTFDAFRNGMAGVVERAWGKPAVSRIVPGELSVTAAVLGAADAAGKEADRRKSR